MAKECPDSGVRESSLFTHSLQLQGELQSKKDAPRLYRGVFHGVTTILKNDGPAGLFRGIGAAVRSSFIGSKQTSNDRN